ncbi:hypothetical protein MKMG_01287 [Methanogenium sp. MK-MG]|nr:hypothetical protein MKMG_01287 [Methanogenium sp. MK-MG]
MVAGEVGGAGCPCDRCGVARRCGEVGEDGNCVVCLRLTGIETHVGERFIAVCREDIGSIECGGRAGTDARGPAEGVILIDLFVSIGGNTGVEHTGSGIIVSATTILLIIVPEMAQPRVIVGDI